MQPVRRLLGLAAIAAGAWWLFGRRGRGGGERVAVGYADGSAVTLEEGAPQLERMLEIARAALAR